MSLKKFFSAADLVASIVGVKRHESSSDLPDDETRSQTKKVKLEEVSDNAENASISTDKLADDNDDVKDEDPSEDDKIALRQVN